MLTSVKKRQAKVNTIMSLKLEDCFLRTNPLQGFIVFHMDVPRSTYDSVQAFFLHHIKWKFSTYLSKGLLEWFSLVTTCRSQIEPVTLEDYLALVGDRGKRV